MTTIFPQRAQQTWSRRRQQARLSPRPGAGRDLFGAPHQMFINVS